MITPAYIRTMAEYNAEMNRRLFGAAARVTDAERREPRGAFWGSIHGTLTHILWGDQQWMSRFDGWERPTTPIKQSAGMIADFAELRAEREKADATISRWANKVDDADKRTRRLKLTAAGRALLIAAVPIWKKTHAKVERLLPRANSEELRVDLRVLS